MATRDEILTSLLSERTVDIVTTGRRSGESRTTEIWTTPLFGRVFICGTPNAGKPGVLHQPRDWLANLLAHPDFVVRLKRGVAVELTARAEAVTDEDLRRAVLSAPSTEYYRDKAMSFDAALAHSPMVEVTFTGDAAWLNEAVQGTASE
ncbi:MAG: nitroreductase/quinone reductase family protein [Acidimicrobiia bacterium]|nr:nitroreductase/quinone reductase family protein [Acidimicrobiia bacterium]